MLYGDTRQSIHIGLHKTSVQYVTCYYYSHQADKVVCNLDKQECVWKRPQIIEQLTNDAIIQQLSVCSSKNNSESIVEYMEYVI